MPNRDDDQLEDREFHPWEAAESGPIWSEIMARAKALTERLRKVPGAPTETWSFVANAAEKLSPRTRASSLEHAKAQWYVAMRWVALNVLRGRESDDHTPTIDELVGSGRAPTEFDETLAIVTDALDELVRLDVERGKDYGKIVALRFFQGCTWGHVAEELDRSIDSLSNDWRFVSSWLKRELKRRGLSERDVE
ncbi:MAG: hypothetical protein GY711_23975 [bacterium]|nr:hypothetical protein [bacterium]